jgi:hypothetical protein
MKRAMIVIRGSRFNWSRRSISWDAVSPPLDSFMGYSSNLKKDETSDGHHPRLTIQLVPPFDLVGCRFTAARQLRGLFM